MKSIIYSSKLYIASSRKDRINAAMAAPGNIALVQQLSADLDEEYKTPENMGQSDEVKEEDQSENNIIVDMEVDPKKDLMTVDDLVGKHSSRDHSAPSHSPSPSPSGPSEKPEGDEGPDTSELMPESPANEKPQKEEKPVEESTQIKSVTIIKPEEKVNLETLKGSLNAREDTCGVLRIAEKEEKEVWIYYNDDVNLNDIMTNVIEFVANAGFTALEFNRLARSDNAIVFELVRQTVSIPNSKIESPQPKDLEALNLEEA